MDRIGRERKKESEVAGEQKIEDRDTNKISYRRHDKNRGN